jgi:hypothetical protein
MVDLPALAIMLFTEEASCATAKYIRGVGISALQTAVYPADSSQIAYLAPPFSKVGHSSKPYRSVRQPGSLLRRYIDFVPPPHDGFTFLAALPRKTY